MEQLDLTTPVVPPSITHWRVALLRMDWDGAQIQIGLTWPTGESLGFVYSGQTATDLMVALNTANLSIKSLHKRVLERLVSDGKLLGTISGTP